MRDERVGSGGASYMEHLRLGCDALEVDVIDSNNGKVTCNGRTFARKIPSGPGG